MSNELKDLVESVDKLSTKVEKTVGDLEEKVATIVEKDTDYRNDLSSLGETVKTWKENGVPIDNEKIEKAIAEILEKQEKDRIQRRPVLSSTESKYVIPDTWKSGTNFSDIVDSGMYSVKSLFEQGAEGLQKLVDVPAMDQTHKHFLRMAVDVKIADELARHTLPRGRQYPGFAKYFPRLSTMWANTVKGYASLYGLDIKAADLTDVANWVPEGWSSELREIVQLKLIVAALFERIPMPWSPYNLPVDLTDSLGNFLPETTAVVNPWDDTDLQSPPTDEKATFTAKKLRARMLTSGELTEDAIIPILAYIRGKIVNILAASQESGIINGSTGTHMDYDVDQLGDKDARQAFDGLRQFCNTNTYETTHSGAAPTVAGLLAIRKAMGEFGVDPADLATICSAGGYIQLLGETNVQTVDKMGPAATILSGQLASIHGVPLIVSRHMPSNLHTTGVNTNGGNNNTTSLIMVYRPAWMIGDKRNVTVESERLINTDQVNVVAFQRLDFQPVFGTAKAAWQLFNVLA